MSGKVVCMVRGGESGRKVQELAINCAKKGNLNLVFLHIIDPHGFSTENATFKKAWVEEMTWLGRVTLGLARRRAQENGIKGEMAILVGPIFPTTVSFLKENAVSRLFIGSPHQGAVDYDHRLAGIQRFAEQITQATGVEVVIAGVEEAPGSQQ